jgi:probable F420-dependent oxidoreductase
VSRPIRIGVQIEPQHADYADILAAVVQAEELGVDIIFAWDHFFPQDGDPDGKHFECWTLLAAWAEATSQVELGALVTCNSYRNPDLLADMARTVDHISGGRLIFGIGSGWFRRDYDEYGYEFGTRGSRLDDLGEALPRIRQRWAKLNPPPVRDLPILIGGKGERKTLRYVAEHASIWHTYCDAEELMHKSAVLKQHCDAVGRDPADIERSVGFKQNETPDAAEDRIPAGATLFTVNVKGPGHDFGVVREWLAWRDHHNAA